MSNDKSLAVVPRTLDEVNSLSELLSKSTLLPEGLRGKVADIAVSILAGQELGLSPMAAIRGVHVVAGKPVLSADTMVALVLGSGLCEYFQCVEESDAKVTYETKRKGSPLPQRCSWTIEDSKRAGLDRRENHRLYPRAMMKARAKSILARDCFPDVCAGVYTDDEIERVQTIPHGIVVANGPANDVIDAEVLQPPQELADLEAATTREAVKALAPKLAGLAEPWKSKGRDRYTARLKDLSA